VHEKGIAIWLLAYWMNSVGRNSITGSEWGPGRRLASEITRGSPSFVCLVVLRPTIWPSSTWHYRTCSDKSSRGAGQTVKRSARANRLDSVHPGENRKGPGPPDFSPIRTGASPNSLPFQNCKEFPEIGGCAFWGETCMIAPRC
jgi:hypothetical protein